MRRYPPGFCPCQPRSPVSGLVFLSARQFAFALPQRTARIFTTAKATDGCLGCFIAATYLSPLLAGAFTDGRLGIVRVALSGTWWLRRAMHSGCRESPDAVCRSDAGCARGWRSEVGSPVHRDPSVCR